MKKEFKKEGNKQFAKTCKPFDQYLNINDDFKTNLLWLSFFVPTVEGVGMRIPVNYRHVLQSNYFATRENDDSISTAVYQPDGDTFQNSPIKLVFFCAFPKTEKQPDIALKMSSISKVNINALKSGLPVQKEQYSSMTIQNSYVQCTWPRQNDLQDFLFFLGFHPIENLTDGVHDFPWNLVLSIFNNQDMSDPLALKRMLQTLGMEYIYVETLSFEENLRQFKEFFRFMTPISSSATEGDHRIDLANRLLYGIILKEEAPFLQVSQEFIRLPFNSTVFKPVSTSVFLPAKNSSQLSLIVTSHLQLLSRKIASQKKLFIEDSWKSLYLNILDEIENDSGLMSLLYDKQQELYKEILPKRQELQERPCKGRKKLIKVIANVIFRENPTASLALKNEPNPAVLDKWLEKTNTNAWSGMDSNPFAAVSMLNFSILLFL